LNTVRCGLFQEKAAKIEAAYNAALEGAKVKIGDAVSSTMRLMEASSSLRTSFLSTRSHLGVGEGPTSVRVKVLAVPPPDASVKSKLDAIEAQRTGIEPQLLDQAVQEMGELTEVVVSELKRSLQLQMTTLEKPIAASLLEVRELDIPGMLAAGEGLPKQLNVRVGSSEIPYPTIAGLAADMETRRDTAEHLERQRILELQLKLLDAENEYVKDALQGAVGSFLMRHPEAVATSFLELGTKFGPLGITTALYGKMVAASDYQLNLHPPEEDMQDVLEELDSATALESVKRKAEEDDYVAAKQRMLNVERARIQYIFLSRPP
jgi:hypothetical protein